MKVLLLNKQEVEFTRRMLVEGFLATKKDNTSTPKDYTMLKLMLRKTKCVDKKKEK